jgi:hypothetical protein
MPNRITIPSKTHPVVVFSLVIFFLSAAFLPRLNAESLDALGMAELQPKSVVLQNSDFDRESILTPYQRYGEKSSVSGFQFLNANRFSMYQSYSMSFGAGGGNQTSSGLYLNTVSYRLSDPLTLSMDMGFHTPFYNSMPGMQSGNLWDGTTQSSLVLPRIGLEYKPSEHTSFSLQLINGPDAAKAYGQAGSYSPFWRPW